MRVAPEGDPQLAPEPAGLALIGLGLLVLGILGRWRKFRGGD
ncbi:MAG: PEP-CTERM sorting domain-containing protein [Bryobacteraceae bacterium]